jgi:hypothetical protein
MDIRDEQLDCVEHTQLLSVGQISRGHADPVALQGQPRGELCAHETRASEHTDIQGPSPMIKSRLTALLMTGLERRDFRSPSRVSRTPRLPANGVPLARVAEIGAAIAASLALLPSA